MGYFSPSNVAQMLNVSLNHSLPAAALAYQRVVSARLQFFTMQHSALHMEHGKETELAKLEVDQLHSDMSKNNKSVVSVTPVNLDYSKFDPNNPTVDTPGPLSWIWRRESSALSDWSGQMKQLALSLTKCVRKYCFNQANGTSMASLFPLFGSNFPMAG